MKTTIREATGSGNNGDHSFTNKSEKKSNLRRRDFSRRAFLRGSLAAGAGTIGLGLLGNIPSTKASRGGLTPNDAALLRFAAAAELLEADFWIQYNELGGIQDSEVPGGTGNTPYTDALNALDEDMSQYVHDNTDDEITHHQFLNAYLVSHDAFAQRSATDFRKQRDNVDSHWKENVERRTPNVQCLNCTAFDSFAPAHSVHRPGRRGRSRPPRVHSLKRRGV